MEFEALVRMMQASDERHAQDRKAMMMAIAKLYQKQSPEKPAPAAEKEPTPSPARAAKKQTKLTSPKKNAQKKKALRRSPRKHAGLRRSSRKPSGSSPRSSPRKSLRRSPRKHRVSPPSQKKGSSNDDSDDGDKSDDSDYNESQKKSSSSSSEDAAVAKSPSLTNLVAKRKNIRKRKSPALVKMRNLINSKLKAEFDTALLRGDYHDSMHNFLPDTFEDAIRDTLCKIWPDHKLQATAFSMACDVAKRRYKYVNKTVIDLTSSKSQQKKNTSSKSPKSGTKRRRKIILPHPKSEEDLGSVDALFEDSSEGPVGEVRFMILI